MADTGLPVELQEPDFGLAAHANRRSASWSGLVLTLPAKSGFCSNGEAVGQSKDVAGTECNERGWGRIAVSLFVIGMVLKLAVSV